MPTRSANREPDDSTRPHAFSRAEWLRITSHLKLNRRQSEILGLVILGYSDKEIARHRKIVPRTVRDYIEDCKRRLATDRRTAFGHATIVVFRKLHGG